MLAVSGNGGRLIIRSWFRESLAAVHAHIADYFENLRIANVYEQGDIAPLPKLWSLLGTLHHDPMKVNDAHLEQYTTQLFLRAFQGIPVGRKLLHKALRRHQLSQGDQRLNTARLGLIRLAVNDLERTQQKGESLMSAQLDENLDHPAYLCGRLMAAYGAIQYAAQKDTNVNVIDRYYSMAMTNPRLAFPKLDQLCQAHLKKLRRDNPGARYRLEQLIDELALRIGGVFPTNLSLEDQGRFVLGYHHQKAEDSRARQEKAAAKQNAEEAALTEE
jgi:CRISPR-associated protein Csd1